MRLGMNFFLHYVFSKRSFPAHKFLEKHSRTCEDTDGFVGVGEGSSGNQQVKRLAGADVLLRLCVGDFRVVFSIEQEELLQMIAIGDRGDIYRHL